MNEPRANVNSKYMEWAKLCSTSRFNLASSGMMDYPLRELPVGLDDLEINGPTVYGYGPLQERLVKKTGAPAESIVAAIGTSMANTVALAALIEPGDEVLIEQPTYDPLLNLARWFGASVRRFVRMPEKGFRLGLGELERQISLKTKLIIIANLHNPSSAMTDEVTMRQVGEMAAKVGARVMVDEVYLEALFDRPWRSAFHLGDNFIGTSSLTKGYGLSGLRCGWILAPPDLVSRMWQIVDLFYGTPAHIPERLSVVALDNLDRVAARAKELLDANRQLLNDFLESRNDLDVAPSEQGTTIFPRLRTGRVDDFLRLLREEFETTVVPGSFFESPQHFRIGIGVPTEILQQGLERLGSALDRHAETSRAETRSKDIVPRG
jgi:aspartate/methionine/tyrosine aminotransferase